MKQTINLDENKFRELIKENVRQILNEAENGGWVVETSEAEEAYNFAAQILGNEELNQAIVRAMSNETLAQILAYLFRMYNLKEWGDYKAKMDGLNDYEEDMFINETLNEYEGMDDSWSYAAVFGENQRDIYDMLWQVKLALQKKIKRGVEIRKDILANSSVVRRAAQITLKRFNEYNKEVGEEPFDMDNEVKRGLREYYAEKILNWIKEEEWNKQNQSTDETINETLKRIFKTIKNQ